MHPLAEHIVTVYRTRQNNVPPGERARIFNQKNTPLTAEMKSMIDKEFYSVYQPAVLAADPTKGLPSEAYKQLDAKLQEISVNFVQKINWNELFDKIPVKLEEREQAKRDFSAAIFFNLITTYTVDAKKAKNPNPNLMAKSEFVRVVANSQSSADEKERLKVAVASFQVNLKKHLPANLNSLKNFNIEEFDNVLKGREFTYLAPGNAGAKAVCAHLTELLKQGVDNAFTIAEQEQTLGNAMVILNRLPHPTENDSYKAAVNGVLDAAKAYSAQLPERFLRQAMLMEEEKVAKSLPNHLPINDEMKGIKENLLKILHEVGGKIDKEIKPKNYTREAYQGVFRNDDRITKEFAKLCNIASTLMVNVHEAYHKKKATQTGWDKLRGKPAAGISPEKDKILLAIEAKFKTLLAKYPQKNIAAIFDELREVVKEQANKITKSGDLKNMLNRVGTLLEAEASALRPKQAVLVAEHVVEAEVKSAPSRGNR